MQLVRKHRLEEQGLKNIGTVYWNFTAASLYEEVVRRREGLIAHHGHEQCVLPQRLHGVNRRSGRYNGPVLPAC